MDEIIQKLLGSELLSEEVKAELQSDWAKAVDNYKQTVREEVTVEVRSEIAEMWTAEKEAFVDKIDAFVNQQLTEELNELKGDIERFRDLEAEYAEKLVEEKHALAGKLSEELDELVDKIDAFFEVRLEEEMSELREDLEVVKENQFGRKIFEAFASEFGKSHVNEDSVQAKLAVAQHQLQDAKRTIKKLEEQHATVSRDSKMKTLLAPLTGKKREQMEFVLQNVETSRLDEAYRHFIGRVLKEDGQLDSGSQLNENKSQFPQNGKLVTGNVDNKAQGATAVNEAERQFMRLAGISSS